MNAAAVLSLYDREMRAQPPEEEGTRIEKVAPVVRQVGEHCTILFSSLSASSAPAVIRRETSYFKSLGKELEWKVYGHDQPPDLGSLLHSTGYVADPPETLVVFDLAKPLTIAPVDQVAEVRLIASVDELDTAIAVSEHAFGKGEGWDSKEYADRVGDPSFAAYIAYVNGIAVASARLEMPSQRSFASLWGGGTAPEYRGRGVYRHLVSVRAEMARSRGYRFLTVDARESSRPILERLGFEPIDTITGWILKPNDDRSTDPT